MKVAQDTDKRFQTQNLKNIVKPRELLSQPLAVKVVTLLNELPYEMLSEKLNVLHMNNFKTIMLSPHVESKVHNEILK